MIPFTKMQGCGNDYVYVDCMDRALPNPAALSVRLADRHFGVGGDGLILICPSETADARMRMFNADGSEGRMCGNGVRCVGKYLYDSGIARRETVTVETPAGIKELRLQMRDGQAVGAEVDMGKPRLRPARVPVRLPGERVVAVQAPIGGQNYRITCVSMGNPHCVVFGEDPDRLPLERVGPRFEHDPLFPEGVNAEFVQVIDPRTLKMRVWERGSGETLACGTGACASVVAAVLNGCCPMGEAITVRLRGGELVVRWTEQGVRMAGPAVTVFTGEIELPPD